MKIKVLSDASVKVLMENEDINTYQMPFSALNQNDAHSLEFICELLFIILEKTGISFLEDDLMIEATGGWGGNYYILVSRSDQSVGIHLKKDGHQLDNVMFIYMFTNPRDFRGLAACFARFSNFIPTDSELFKLGKQYYILLAFDAEQTKNPAFRMLECSLCEYFEKCRRITELEGVLRERGEMLCATLLPFIEKKCV